MLMMMTAFSTPSFAGPAAPKHSGPAPTTTSTTSVSAPAPQAEMSPEAPAQTRGTVLEVATNAGQFSTLVAAINAAGLTETLSGAGPFTVFAPTDAAFAKLPAGTRRDFVLSRCARSDRQCGLGGGSNNPSDGARHKSVCGHALWG
jgi:uncharacterized surface protein with fasciclin (FAS1) repeats